jgi:hypothetical protein
MNRLVSAPCRRFVLGIVAASIMLAGQSVTVLHAEPKEPQRSQNPAELVPFIDAMRAYLDVIDRLHSLTHDPGSAGVAGVIGSLEILKSTKNPQEVIEYFTKLLPDVKNESIQRAIHIELAELYKSTNQPEKALGELRILILTAPPDHPAPTARDDSARPEAPAAAAPTQQENADLTKAGEVLRLYREGMQAERRADWGTALSKYQQAEALPVEFHPTDLSARLRVAREKIGDSK